MCQRTIQGTSRPPDTSSTQRLRLMLTAMYDIDGTLSAQPHIFCQIMCALKAAGWHNAVVSGDNPDSPSGGTFQDKCNYLQSVGITECWDELVVIPSPTPEIRAQIKAQWCKDNAVSVMFDNDKGNADAAVVIGVPLVLVPWATRERDK